MSLRFLPITALLFVCCLLASAQSTLPPSWVYSSYLGGAKQDGITAQTRDSQGNIYVTGTSTSPTFPTTPGVYEPDYPGAWGYNAIFVSKFAPDGSLVWSTFLGPGCSQYIVSSGIQVDSDQNVYVAGIDECYTFPTTAGLPNWGTVFLAKLNPSGSQLLYSADLGNWAVLGTPTVAIDSAGEAFVTGSGGGCFYGVSGNIGPLGGTSDFWIAEINSAGTAVKWCVTIGGTGDDESHSMVIDSANMLYLTGYSDSLDFPVTAGALNQPGASAFVVKIDPAKKPSSSMVYGALVGAPPGNTNPFIEPFSIAVDPSGDTFVSNWTYNLGMYTSPNAFQRLSATSPDGYVFELNPAASAIINGTYIGGSGDDYASAVSVDHSGNTYVSGFTSSWDFPTTAYGYVVTPFSLGQSFYLKLNRQFTAISSVKYGSPDGTGTWSSVPDGSQGLWVSGNTGSKFDTTPNAFQPQYNGDYDGYLLHTDFAGLCSTTNLAFCLIGSDPSSSERIHFTAQSVDVESVTSIALVLDGMTAYSAHAAQFDIWLPVAPGKHTATVIAHASTLQEAQQSLTVQASSTCPLNPQLPSLTVCSPLNAAVVSGSINVIIQANDGNAPPATVALYADGKFVATLKNQNGSYAATLALPAGNHTLSAQGKDTNADFMRTSAVFQVK